MQLSILDRGNYTCSMDGLRFNTEIFFVENTAIQTNQVHVPFCHLTALKFDLLASITMPRNTYSHAVTYVLGAGKEGFLILQCIFALFCYF